MLTNPVFRQNVPHGSRRNETAIRNNLLIIMTQKIDQYLITLTRENAERVAKLAEDIGY